MQYQYRPYECKKEKKPEKFDDEKKCDDDKKRKRYSVKQAQCLPAVSAAFACALTEGKSVREMETLALFFNSLSNDIFLIAGMRNKYRGFFFDDFIL